MSFVTIAAIAALSSFTPPPPESVASVRDAKAMLAHWKCSTWAALSGNDTNVELHFNNGMLFGRRFYDALHSDKFSQSELNREIPTSVLLTSSGPSIDFILGRVFEYASSDAHDEVVKKSSDGSSLDPRDYILDRDIQSIRASTNMRTSNCSSLEFLARD